MNENGAHLLTCVSVRSRESSHNKIQKKKMGEVSNDKITFIHVL